MECQIEQLLLLVVPNQEVAYDPIKDDKWIQEFKQSKLQQFELAKKKEREKGNKSSYIIVKKYIHEVG